MKYLFFLFIVSLLFFQCKKTEVCLEEHYAGEYELAVSSKEAFPYHKEPRLIFSDSLGNEIFGTVDKPASWFVTHITRDVPCSIDNSFIISTVEALVENYSTNISFQEIDTEFWIRFSSDVDLWRYSSNLYREKLRILPRGVIIPDSSLHIPQLQISLAGNYSPAPSTTFLQSTIKIHDKEFKDIYTNRIGRDFIEIYYSLSEGLIGFLDKTRNLHYKFERIE